MIRGNLATRPFYNEPAVHLWLFVAALVVVVATLFNVVQMLRYSRSDTELAQAGRQRRSPGDGAPRRRGAAARAPWMRNRLNARRSRRIRRTS